MNVIKRCRQCTDIKWTPAVDLPRLMRVQTGYPVEDTVTDELYEGVFKAGTEYTGIPYGRANDMGDYGYSYGYYGRDITPETFITSVVNPNSMLCKESHFNKADKETTRYALVCSAMTCYALNTSNYYATANIPDIPGLNLIGKINDNGDRINDGAFQLGRVLNETGVHTAIITDVIRNTTGDVVYVELSEATLKGIADKNYADGQNGGLCIRRGWTIEEIYTIWGDYEIYDYAYIANVPYTASPFVNVGDEFDRFRITHSPCMPYPGEGFKYKSGSIPNTDIIISPNLGFDYLRVFKDGTEISGSPFAVTSQTEKVSVGFSETGDYTAYLCKMSSGHDTKVSYPCHWSVVS